MQLFACKKGRVQEGSEVELYLLQSFQQVSGKCQVNPSSAVLQSVPLVSSNDILKYHQSEHVYTLSNNAIQKIKALSGRTPFALTVDRQVIFTGYYMPLFMSSTCEHSITINDGLNNTLNVQLGYPSFFGASVEDRRNHPKILESLLKQGKLR